MSRYDVLEMLKNNTGHVSGEEISRILGVSRAAIWKYINLLREEGYDIRAVTNKGYRLADEKDVLNPFEVGRGILGADNIYVEKAASTNTCLKEMAAAGNVPEGTCVFCSEQTEGRGRLGRSWFAPTSKNVSMSVLLRPDIQPVMAPGFSLFAGVCVYEAVSGAVGGMRIKWPNDILIKGKKVCGILTEMTSELDKVDYIIIGIGINIFDSGEDMKAAAVYGATSLEEETGSAAGLKRAEVIRNVLDAIEREYPRNRNGVTKDILERWKRYSSSIGEIVSYDSGDIRGTGVIEDIDSSGALIIRTENGTETVRSGTINERPRH